MFFFYILLIYSVAYFYLKQNKKYSIHRIGNETPNLTAHLIKHSSYMHLSRFHYQQKRYRIFIRNTDKNNTNPALVREVVLVLLHIKHDYQG